MVLQKKKYLSTDIFSTIRLSGGLFCIVDNEDYIWLSKNRWKAKKSAGIYYAVRTEIRHNEAKDIRMHRYISHCPHLCQVHHKNGNGLDNRKCNLQIVTRDEHKKIHNLR